MSCTIISGSPGAGKTSLARLLAAHHPRGVHLETDAFFRFLAHRVDPSLVEAREQNHAVVGAYAKAAAEYVAAGFAVYIDGVIGPWLFPRLAPLLGEFDYVLLHVPLEVALSRTRARTSQPSADSGVVRRMHGQFAAIVDRYRPHLIDAAAGSTDELLASCLAGQASGRFRLGGT